MKISEVRSRFLRFYEERGHRIIPSASLVPENDQTTLFTGSGMQPMLPYLLGEEHPLGTRIVDSQKCFRGEDIDEVGDSRHTTFFEMLGNWSLGDYFKSEQLPWIFEFLTSSSVGLDIDPNRLYVTIFAGDEENNLPRDTESASIWSKLFSNVGIIAKEAHMGSEEDASKRGIQTGERIFYYSAKKNWWSRAGVPSNMPIGEPGGPDSEIFYEFTDVPHDSKYGEHCHPNCDCGRFLEIGNSVFMQYIKTKDTFEKLPKENVDFGGGLERMSAVTENFSDIFEIDVFRSIIQFLEIKSGKQYQDKTFQKSFRIVADHVRGALFMVSEGILPSNTEQGYFVRRLIRRAVRHADILGVEQGSLSSLVGIITSEYEDTYPLLRSTEKENESMIHAEEEKFRVTLERGLKEFEKISRGHSRVSGEDAFILFSTYGFPVELTQEMADEKGLGVDREAFEKAFKEHQNMSRKGAEKKFKGGLGDTSDMSVRYHTATHLLNAALRHVLGTHVEQRGSNITPERLRFDFSHPEKLTDDQKKAVELFVNEAIHAALPVQFEEMSLEEAHAIGAVGVFGDKYSNRVRVYTIGFKDEPVSIEICGGPHVKNTQELGHFTILKEEASSAGVRRIKAILKS